eukprot:Partr_v1_DN27512_c5_g2_i2_m30262 putative Cyclin-dependent protein kinase
MNITSSNASSTTLARESPPDIQTVVEMTCNLLEKLLETNDQFSVPPGHLTRFHARSIPNITIKRYILRLLKYAPFPSVCLFTVLAYIDRLAARRPNFIINSFNVHRVIMTTLTLAVKFHCDHLYTNKHYAKVGGISARELMFLEFDMLGYLGYEIAINVEEVDLYSQRLYALHQPAPQPSLMVLHDKITSNLSTPTPSRAPTPQAVPVFSGPASIQSSTGSLHQHLQAITIAQQQHQMQQLIINDASQKAREITTFGAYPVEMEVQQHEGIIAGGGDEGSRVPSPPAPPRPRHKSLQ